MVSPKDLSKTKIKIEGIVYDASEPIHKVFSVIDHFTKVAEMCNRPHSPEQKGDMAYIILQNSKNSRQVWQNGMPSKPKMKKLQPVRTLPSSYWIGINSNSTPEKFTRVFAKEKY